MDILFTRFVDLRHNLTSKFNYTHRGSSKETDWIGTCHGEGVKASFEKITWSRTQPIQFQQLPVNSTVQTLKKTAAQGRVENG